MTKTELIEMLESKFKDSALSLKKYPKDSDMSHYIDGNMDMNYDAIEYIKQLTSLD